MPSEHLPTQNPYTLEQAMDPGFWPGGEELPKPGRERRS